MKRPFGVTGLTFLVTLAVVYYFRAVPFVTFLVVGATAAAVVSAGLCVRRKKSKPYDVIAASLSVLAAIAALFLFQTFRVDPVHNKYVGNQVRLQGYVTDDIRNQGTYDTYVLHAETIEGEPSNEKVSFTTHSHFHLQPFERVSVTLTPEKATYDYSVSRGIYLHAYEDDSADLHRDGGRHESILTLVSDWRLQMKKVLNTYLDDEAAAIAKAVLLGDKGALPKEIRRAFNATGTSYLVVVSGMHLSIAVALLRLILRRRKRTPRIVSFLLILLFILLFAALTGFTAPVIRAGVMLLLFYGAKIFLRTSDSINSLGIAALVLTLPNPYAVGDVGLLLSFSATFGILLWGTGIRRYLLFQTGLETIKKVRLERTFAAKLLNLLRRFARKIITVTAISLAATLWVVPVTVLFFRTVSPLTVIVSLFAYPLTCVVLWLSLVLVLAGLTPFPGWFAMFVAQIDQLMAHMLIGVVEFFAQLPFATVKTDKAFWFVWLGVTAALVIIGYCRRRTGRYVLCTVVVSVLTLTIGGSLTYLFPDKTPVLTVYRYGRGYAVSVQKGKNLSYLSCGGSDKGLETILSPAEECGQVDMVILPSAYRRNTACFASLMEEYAVKNVFICEAHRQPYYVSDDNTRLFPDNARFTTVLNADVNVTVAAINQKVYQYIYSEETSVLIVPDKATLRDLPEDLRSPDVVLFEGKAGDIDLLTSQNLLTLGDTPNAQPIPNKSIYTLKLNDKISKSE